MAIGQAEKRIAVVDPIRDCFDGAACPRMLLIDGRCLHYGSFLSLMTVYWPDSASNVPDHQLLPDDRALGMGRSIA